MKKRIYADCNATCPPCDETIEIMKQYYKLFIRQYQRCGEEEVRLEERQTTEQIVQKERDGGEKAEVVRDKIDSDSAAVGSGLDGVDVVRETELTTLGNSATAHAEGQAAHTTIERSRAEIEMACHAPAGSLVFTSGATESMEIAMRIVARAAEAAARCGRICSFIESDDTGIGGKGIAFDGSTKSVEITGTRYAAVLGSVDHKCSLHAARDALLPVAPGRVKADEYGTYSASCVTDALDACACADKDQCAFPAVVSLLAAQNEFGTIQPVAELVSAVREWSARLRAAINGATGTDTTISSRFDSAFATAMLDSGLPVVIIDAAQAIGKTEFNVTECGADAVVWSAHKIGGPCSVGGLFILPGAATAKWVVVGRSEPDRVCCSVGELVPPPIDTREYGLRAGTADAIGIACAAAAVCSAIRGGKERGEWKTMFAGSKHIIEMIDKDQRIPQSAVAINGAIARGNVSFDKALCNTVSLSVRGVCSKVLARLLDTKYGVAVGVGSACSSVTVSSLPVSPSMAPASITSTASAMAVAPVTSSSQSLDVIGVPHEYSAGTIRISTSKKTTPEEYAELARRICDAIAGCLANVNRLKK